MLTAIVLGGAVLQSWGIAGNPPGAFVDESSIAYNAHGIATGGRDEHGTAWPLYFRAFGEYKNAPYVYLLAAVFRVTGPSLVAARLLSGALSVGTAIVLATLAWRLTRRRSAALGIGLSALVTPWLFELGRVVLEAALFPLATALFLLAAQRLAADEDGGWRVPAAVAGSLALLTYGYSVGRLLGPLLAIGLLLLVRRARPLDVPLAWLLYLVFLVPLAVFTVRHPGALTSRFRWLSYLAPERGLGPALRDFGAHFAANLDPRLLLVTGDPNRDQIAHLAGTPNLLAATAALALLGTAVALGTDRARRRWWAFVVYGLLAAVVPASLTVDRLHTLRLAAVPVFLLVLAAPGIAWLVPARASTAGAGTGRAFGGLRTVGLALLALATVVQAALFQARYHASAHTERRLEMFDGGYVERILGPALASGQRPVHLADSVAIPGYIQAYWHATTRGVGPGTFTLLPPAAPAPAGALVITTEDVCPRCRVLSRWAQYTVYRAEGPPRAPSPLPPEALRARVERAVPLGPLRAGEKAVVRAVVVNAGRGVWPARERSAEPFQVALGNHWLTADGVKLVHDDGRAAIPLDLAPGESAAVRLTVGVPGRPGSYLLELDMLQEGVTWFGDLGSPTLRLPVRVE